MAVRKKSSNNRFFSSGFFTNASLMLPRKRLEREREKRRRVDRRGNDQTKKAFYFTIAHSYIINPSTVIVYKTFCCLVTYHVHTWKLLDLHKSKQGNTTNQSNSLFKEKRAAQVGLEPTTYCLLGRCSTTELPRQLNGWVELRKYNLRKVAS